MKIDSSQILLITAVAVPVVGFAIIGLALLTFKKKAPQRPSQDDTKPRDKQS